LGRLASIVIIVIGGGAKYMGFRLWLQHSPLLHRCTGSVFHTVQRFLFYILRYRVGDGVPLIVPPERV
jgi:hypothetical protein